MIKKQKKIIFITLGIIIILTAAYFILSNTLLKEILNPDDTPTIGNHGETMLNGRPFIIDQFPTESIKQIEVKNPYGTYTYYLGEDGEYYFKDSEMMLYKDDIIAQLTTTARYMLAIEEVVGYDKSNLSNYGLGDNSSWLKVTYTDPASGNERTEKIYIGNRIVTSGGYYIMLEGRDALYIMDSTYIDAAVLVDIKTFFSAQVSPYVTSSQYSLVKTFSIKKHGEEFMAMRLLSEEEKDAYGNLHSHIMSFPQAYYPSGDNMELVLSCFSSFIGEKVVEYKISDYLKNNQMDELYSIFKKYGLMDENKQWVCEIDYNYDYDNAIYISSLNENGKYYIYSPAFDLIAEFSPENLGWVEWDILHFLDNHVYMQRIDDVKSIKFEWNSKEAVFNLSGEGSDLKVTESSGRINVDTENFRQLYKSLVYPTIEGYGSKAENDPLNLTVTIERRDGTRKMEYKFYGISSRKTFYTLNGEGEFYIKRDYVNQIISNVESILKGEKAVAEYKN